MWFAGTAIFRAFVAIRFAFCCSPGPGTDENISHQTVSWSRSSLAALEHV